MSENPEQDSTIVITGASSGIGKATALRVAERHCGIKLCLFGRNAMRLREVAERCEAHGARTETCIVDFSANDWAAKIEKHCSTWSIVRGLVNCAGFGSFKSVGDIHLMEWEELIRVNLTVPFFLVKTLLPSMKRTLYGATIVNVSSDADSTGFKGATAYCASKAGMRGFSQAAALDLRELGIRVCVVSPGRVDTCFNGKAPGMRPGSLEPSEVAEVIEFALFGPSNIDLQQVRLDSMSRLG